MIFPVPTEPPEIVIFNRIQYLPSLISVNERGDRGLFFSLMYEAVNGHDPSHEKTMFFKGTGAV